MRRSVKVTAATLALAGVVAVGAVATGAVSLSSPGPSASPASAWLSEPGIGASPSPVASPTPAPSPTPSPTPILVPAPLSGRLVTPRDAAQHPIAVMIDDAPAARPQSGFNAASVVWQAPAEGGVPRYMMIFQEQVPTDVGPVRSARSYFIDWASEWNAVYGHVGGSPQAMSTLRSEGNGQLVYNADEFRWGGIYYRRIKERQRAPQRLLRRQVIADHGNPRRGRERTPGSGLDVRP